MMNNYPDDSIQCLANAWWESIESKELTRGSLVYAHIQFFSEIPLELIAERVTSCEHDKITLKAKPLSLNRNNMRDAPTLPVAALPRLEGADCYITNRAKKRPCLVLGTIERPSIARALLQGMSNHSTAPFVSIAPFYGVEQKGRAGYNPEFVERIKHATYPQFMWDILPHTENESMLRFDQLQPLGIHHQSYSHTGYKLSEEALNLIDEWLYWYINGIDGKEIASMRELINETEKEEAS